jgi:hypothetical protein
LFFLVAPLWTGTLIHWLPDGSPQRARLIVGWHHVVLPLMALLYVGGIAIGSVTETPALLLYLVLAIAAVAPLLFVAVSVWGGYRRSSSSRPVGILLVSALFLGLEIGLLIIPISQTLHSWLLLALGFDLGLLSIGVAFLDAFEQGETLRLHILRSFDMTLLAAAIWGVQIALIVAWIGQMTLPLALLTLSGIATAITLQIGADPIAGWIDRIALARLPGIRKARAELRAVGDALPRMPQTIDLTTMNEVEFVRLIRRALSAFGDLPRLATNPLTALPLITIRLKARNVPDNALERALELKNVLSESVRRLKPSGNGEFGITAEWRHYNALYFPYIVGIKPFNTRANYDDLDPILKQALEWFQSQVPERTLYNWQSAATKLVASDLRERILLVADTQDHAAPQHSIQV